MSTAKQIAANRRNAQKSTGPRSSAGKTQAALNSRKHGFAGSNFTVVRLEDHQAIENLRADALAFYQPVNSQEIFAVERIALCQMALLRISRLESGMLSNCLDLALDPYEEPRRIMSPELAGNGDIEITKAQNRNFVFADGLHRATEKPHTWELFLRYQNQTERLYRRAVEEFNRLVALRPTVEETEESEQPQQPLSGAGFQTCNAAFQPAPPPTPNEANFAEPESFQGVPAPSPAPPNGPTPVKQPILASS